LERATELGLSREDRVVVYPTIAPAFTPQPSGTRVEWRAALGIREAQVVLNVKRLHELAGQRYLIEAFARATEGRRDVRLVICGTGALRETLEAQARASGAADRITFAGLVANDEVARYAAVADVFVLPSLLEALPTVAVEALASGTPVISADHPGGVELHEIFTDDVQVVAKADAAALAHALRVRLESPRRVNGSTLDLVTRHFGRAAVHAAYDAVYRMALR
jgi:glycosyltransferase involved in cell wall biosynthesis